MNIISRNAAVSTMRFGRRATPDEIKEIHAGLKQAGAQEPVYYAPFCLVYEEKPPYSKLDPRRLFSDMKRRALKEFKEDFETIQKALETQPEGSIKEKYWLNRYILPQNIHVLFKSPAASRPFGGVAKFAAALITGVRAFMWDVLYSSRTTRTISNSYSCFLDLEVELITIPHREDRILKFSFSDKLEKWAKQYHTYSAGAGNGFYRDILASTTKIKEAFKTLNIKQEPPERITREFFDSVIKPARNRLLRESRVHPDQLQNASPEAAKKANEKMQQINLAYELLEKKVR